MHNIGRKYKCIYTDTIFSVEDDFDDSVFKLAKKVQFYIPVSGEKPSSYTHAGMLWDTSFLYVYFKAYDTDIFAFHTDRDSITCEDDVLEIFIKTRPEYEPYYNFEINAQNTVYDAYNLRRNKAGSHWRWSKWNCIGLKSSVFLKGTINNPNDRDEYWQLAVAIPFGELDLGYIVQPSVGDEWKFLLSRYDYSIYLDEGMELSASSHLNELDFHRYEEWGTLEFCRIPTVFNE